ncbi:MAG: hypothetical protein Q4G62_04860 [Pseudomonadota bacterium]|nr:hypothetical protein [Pseudomonadota bacterium]
MPCTLHTAMRHRYRGWALLIWLSGPARLVRSVSANAAQSITGLTISSVPGWPMPVPHLACRPAHVRVNTL